MKSTTTSTQARLRLPGTAALVTTSHDTPNVMQPPKPLRRMLTGLAAALTLGLFVTPASAQQMISNGSFEVGNPVPGSSGQLAIAAGDTANLPGWTASTGGMGWYFRATAWGMTAPDGAFCFNLNSPTGVYTLSQSLAVAAGDTYTVSYYEKRRGNGGYMDTTVSVADGLVSGADGSPVAVAAGPAASIVQATAANAAWTLHSFTFTPDTTTTATITFGNHYGGGQGDNDGVFLDKVSVLGPATLTETTTTVTLNSGSSNPSTYGDSLSFDVTLDPTTATGTVELYDGGAGGTLIGTGTLLGGTCTITPATTALAVGTHANIVAVYLGDTTHATSTSVALSPAQVVNSAGATALLITTPPSGAQPGVAWATQPTVKVLDAGGYLVADSSASITLEITTGTPASGGPGTLIGTKTVTAVNGVATFSGLSIDTAGVGYRLTATSTDLTPADSALFTISSGTVLYDSTACSGQFPRTTLPFTPVEGHVYTLSFSLNNPDASLNNCLIGFSSDNAYNANTLIDGFWVSGTWVGNGSVRRNYNGGIVESSFTTAGVGNGYWGPPGELDSNFEVVLDTTSLPWTTVTSMSSCLGTLSGSVRTALGTAKSVQVWVRDPGNNFFPTISNFRLTESALLVPQANILSFGPGAVINQADRTITWTVANGTDVTTLAPEFTLSVGATCTVDGNPVVSGAQFDFTSPVHYVVSSSAPVITRDYTVTVKVLPQLALPVTAGVTVWLDASQLTGLNDGDLVATWTDMSGWDNNATRSVGSPTYKTGILMGKPVIRFVKANGDAFTTANLSSQFPSAATVFIVTTINPGTAAYSLVCSSAGNPTDEWFRYSGNGLSYPGTFRSSRINNYCAMPDSGSHIFAISSSATAWEMWIDGTGQGAAGGAYSAGGTHVIGSGSNGGTLDGDIAEIIEFNRALNPTEMADMNAFLTTKYFVGSTPSTTTLAANANTTPSAYGDLLSFDVTVSGGEGLDIPTGSVFLKDGGSSGATLGSGTLSPSGTDGVCTITTTTLAVGTHANIVAVYSGDPTYAASTSDPLIPAQTVNSGSSTTTTALARTTGGASETYGSTLAYTATVAGASSSPSGNVEFRDGATVLATVALIAGTAPESTAVYTSHTDLKVAGSPHSIAAYYLGDGTHDPSNSSADPVAQTLTPKALDYSGITAANKPYDGNPTASLSGSASALDAEAPGTGSTTDGKPYTGDTVSFSTGTLTGTFASADPADGIAVTLTGGVTLTGDNSDNYAVGLPAPLLTANITPNFASWIGFYTSIPLADRDPGDDPDGDGLTNEEEYAFGLIPNNGASCNPISVQLNKTTGKFTYTRRNPDLTGISYSILTSTTLAEGVQTGDWAIDDSATQVPSGTGEVQTVEVTLGGTKPLGATTIFVRVKAVVPAQ
jgi:hypothetical protein